MADVTFTISIKDDGTPVLREIKREAEAMGTGVAAAGQKASGGLSSLRSAASGLQGVLGGIGVAAVISQFISLADTARNLEGRLKLVTSSSAELASVQQSLFQIAQQTRVGYEGTVDLYTRLSRSTKQLGTDQGTLLQVTQTINQTLAISGASAESANAALVQLGQGLASGTLRGDEFNSVIEQTPRLAQAIADGMGVTLGQLRALANDGKLTAETVVGSLQKQRAAVEKEFGQLPITVGQAMTLVGNSILKAVGEFDKAIGVSEFLANKIRDLATAVDFTVAHIEQKLEGLKLNRILELKKEISDIQVQLESGARLISTSAGTIDFSTAIALQARLTETLKGLRAEFQGAGDAAAASAPKIATLTPAQQAAQKEAQQLIDKLKEQVQVYGLHGAALANAVAQQALANGASKEQAESIRALTLALEAKKEAQKAATTATKESAKEDKDAAKAAQELIDAELLINKNAAKLAEIRAKETEANKKSADAIRDSAAAIAEENQIITVGIAARTPVVQIERQLAEARIERQIATERAKAAEDGLTEAEEQGLSAKREALRAQLDVNASLDAYKSSTSEGIDAINVFEEALKGLASGTLKDIPDLFEQAGKAALIKFASSFLFGKRDKFDIPFQANLLGLVGPNGIVGDLLGQGGAQGAQQFGGGFLNSLFGGGSGGEGLSSIFGQGGLFGGLFGSPGTTPGFGGVGPNIPGTGIFSGGNPFSFGNLVGGALGSLAGGGISGALGIGQSKPGQLGGGIGGAVGGFGGGILGGALLGAQFGAFAGPIGAAVGAIIGTILGGVAGDLFKPGRIATEKKGEKAFFNEVFGGGFKVLKEPQVAAGFSAFGDQTNANLALGAIYASGQKGATAGTVKREAGQFLGNLKEQGKTTEEVKAATLKLAEAMGADLPTAINKTNELVDKGIFSNEQFAKQMNDSRKNLAQYGDTSTLTAQQLTNLALKNGNVGSTVVTLNKLYAGAIDVSTGFSDAVDSAAIANGLLADKFIETAGGAEKLNGSVGDLAGKVRSGALSVEEAIQQLNGMRTAAGETQLTLNQFTLNPDKIAAEVGLIQASVVEAGKAAEGLGGILSAAILGDLSTLGVNVDKFFQDLFGQQVLGSILQQSIAGLKIEATLAPVFEKILRAQSDFASGALNQDQFTDTLKGILTDAGPEIEKVKAGLLAAGESGRAILTALGLVPEQAREAGDAVDTLATRASAAAATFSAAFANVGQGLGGIPKQIAEQRAALEKQIADAETDRKARQKAEPDINKTVDSAALDDLKKQLADLPSSGGAIGEALASQLAQGFEDGLTQLIIDTALIQAKLEPLKAQIAAMMKEALADGTITAEEQAAIANKTAEGVKEIKDTAEALTPTLDGIHNAAKNIADGTSTAADNFKDIVVSTEKVADQSKAIEQLLGAAKDTLGEANMNPAVSDAKQIKAYLEEAARVINTARVPTSATTGFARGGPVGGVGSGDIVPALLDPREFVMTPQATKANFATLMAMNQGAVVRHFATGGPVVTDPKRFRFLQPDLHTTGHPRDNVVTFDITRTRGSGNFLGFAGFPGPELEDIVATVKKTLSGILPPAAEAIQTLASQFADVEQAGKKAKDQFNRATAIPNQIKAINKIFVGLGESAIEAKDLLNPAAILAKVPDKYQRRDLEKELSGGQLSTEQKVKRVNDLFTGIGEIAITAKDLLDPDAVLAKIPNRAQRNRIQTNIEETAEFFKFLGISYAEGINKIDEIDAAVKAKKLAAVDSFLAPVNEFLNQGAAGAIDPFAAIKAQYQGLVSQIQENRPILQEVGKDVDGLLGQLAAELPKKLRQAFEDANRGLIDATTQLGNTAASLLTGSTSTLSAFDKQALLDTQASDLRGRLATASTDELPQVLQDLSGVLQEQLQLSPFDRFSEDFRSQFFSVVTELKQLQNQTQSRIDAAVADALRVAQPVNLTINVPSGDPALIENVVVKSIQESSGKINKALRARRT